MSAIIDSFPIEKRAVEIKVMAMMSSREQQGYLKILETIQSYKTRIRAARTLLHSEQANFNQAKILTSVPLHQETKKYRADVYRRNQEIVAANNCEKLQDQIEILLKECKSYKILKASYIYHARVSSSSGGTLCLSENNSTELDSAQDIDQPVSPFNRPLTKCEGGSSINQLLASLHKAHTLALTNWLIFPCK